jgi:uncharacterized protein (DUF433 family)
MFEIKAEPVPIEFDENGVARVGGTRVPLETLLTKYHQGASAENLAEAFPSLNIADIHAVLGYYLHNRETVDAYLVEAKQRDEAGIRFIREKFPQENLKERLLARRKKD